MDSEAPKRLLNVREVAYLLGRKESTIRKWVSRNRIPYLKAGRAVCFDWELVLRWLRYTNPDLEKWQSLLNNAPLQSERAVADG
jgi:excisionase family DNA binding protein